MDNESRIEQGRKSHIAKSGQVITRELMEGSAEIQALVPDHLSGYVLEGRTLFVDTFGNKVIMPPIEEPVNKISEKISRELPQSAVIVEPSAGK